MLRSNSVPAHPLSCDSYSILATLLPVVLVILVYRLDYKYQNAQEIITWIRYARMES